MAAVATAALAITAPSATAGPATPHAAPVAAKHPTPAPASLRTSEQSAAQALIRHGKANLIVTVKKGASLDSATTSVKQRGYQVARTLPALRMFTVPVAPAQLGSAKAALQGQPGVASVDVDVARHLDDVTQPNDPSFGAQSNLAAVNAPAAWLTTTNSAVGGPKIAIIDSGIDVTSPDLAGKVSQQLNTVSDLAGSGSLTDDIGHGTFVAGIAAAATNNGIGVAGAGYDTKVIEIKIADFDGTIAVSDEITGIEAAITAGAKVINLSLGSIGFVQAEDDAVQAAETDGLVVVASAGNDGGTPLQSTPNYPAAYPGVISVGATEGSARASYSDFGPWVSVGAPGTAITSTAPDSLGPLDIWNSVDVTSNVFDGEPASGTSFSAPLVSAEAALLMAARPDLTAAQIRATIIGSAHGFVAQGLGTGQVDYTQAIADLPPATAPTSPSPSATPAAGVVPLSVSTTAAFVQFAVDGVNLGGPVASTSGSASTSWTSFGQANGTHTWTASACTIAAVCEQPGQTGSASASFTLNNDAPTLTSPADTAHVTGTIAATATSTAPAVQFVVDGVNKIVDTTAPFAAAFSASALSDGSHTVVALACDASGHSCSGPSSATATVTSNSLHPTVVASPGRFSPNGDHLNDTTTFVFTIPVNQTTTLQILNSAGQVVYTPTTVGLLPAGKHYWVWSGKSKGGTPLPSDTYTMSVNTVAGGLQGWVTASVVLDKTAPIISSLATSPSRFYPYPDGYQDNFVVSMRLNEGGTLYLYLARNNAVFRTESINVGAGNVSISWNGRTAAGAQVAAGNYQWFVGVSDGVHNRSLSGVHTVTVSGARLIAQTSPTYVQSGLQAPFEDIEPQFIRGACATATYDGTTVDLENQCTPGNRPTGWPLAWAGAGWQFRLPSNAVKWNKIQISYAGNATATPAPIYALYDHADGSESFSPLTVRSSGAYTTTVFPSVPASGLVFSDSSGRSAFVELIDDNELNGNSGVDVHSVAFKVSYWVLG